MSLIEIEKKGRIAIFTLNNPDKLNVLSPDMLWELEEDMFNFMEDPELRVGIFTGKGPKAFCAGADIKSTLPFTMATENCPWRYPRTPMRGLHITKPLIAAVNGYAYGGGGELALACDIRIASDNASFRWPEPSLGILPRYGGTQRLPRIVGEAKALEILLTNAKVDAAEALKIGLVSKVVPQEELMDAAMEMAEKVCKLAPLSVINIKRCIYEGSEMEFDKGMQLENELCYKLYHTEDYAEGRKAFMEKRTPDFQGK